MIVSTCITCHINYVIATLGCLTCCLPPQKVSNFWLRQRWQRCNQMWRERCGFHEIHGNPSLVSWCVEGCGIVGDDVERVLSLIVYYSCNYQKSCAVSWLFVFVLKEPTLHPWNFTWFNTSSEKMHHRWSVYSSSSAFSCKEADRLRASHNRLPCDPSLAHARNDDFSWKLCFIFLVKGVNFRQLNEFQYNIPNNRQFESFRSLCLRQQCLFSNSPLATCRFTPTPPFSYLPLQVTMAARLQAPRPCEDPQSNIDEVQRFVLSQKRWSDKEDQQMDFESIARNGNIIQLEQFFETPVQWMYHWHQDLEPRQTQQLQHVISGPTHDIM